MPYSYLSSDNALLQGMLSGNESAFHVLYDRYWEMLYIRAFAIVKTRQDAQDVVQDVFLSIWKRKESLQIQESLRGYLLTSIKFGSLAFLRNQLVRSRYLHNNSREDAEHQNPATVLEARELNKKINSIVEQMPERMRQAYVLSREHKLSYAEIAQLMGISEGTVKKQISNALSLLRKSLANRRKETAIFFLVFISKIIR